MMGEYEVSVRIQAADVESAIQAVKVFGSWVIGGREIGRSGRPPAPSEGAEDFLYGFLTGEGRVKAGDVYAAAKVEGITTRTLRRAAESMGVTKHGKGPTTKWSLP